MKRYAILDRAMEYLLLAAAGSLCAYGILHLFLPSGAAGGDALRMLAGAAAVLLPVCFSRRSARAAGILAAAAGILLSRAAAGSAVWLASAIRQVSADELLRPDGFVTALLCALAASAALFAFFCSRRRLTLAAFWAGSAALFIFLSYKGDGMGLWGLLVATGCCAVLFFRLDAGAGPAGSGEGARQSVRTTALAAVVLAAMLSLTQLAYTGLHAVFGSSPKVSFSDLANRIQGRLFPVTGFGDYDPDRTLGRRVSTDGTLVLEVQADGPFYLRGRIYDTYAGRSWQATEPAGTDDSYRRSLSLRPPGYTYVRLKGVPTYGNFFSERLFGYFGSLSFDPMLQYRTVSVTTKTEGQKYLFLPDSTVGGPTDRLQGAVPLSRSYPDLQTAQAMPAGTEYSFSYVQPNWDSDAFQAAVRDAAQDTKAFRDSFGSGALGAPYEQLNSEMTAAYGSTKGLTGRTLALAESITAGCTDEFQKASAIEQWLEANCTYTLSPSQPGIGQDFVDHFLFDSKEGYCEHFATAMTMLLRASGVPARYVEGYASPAVSGSGLYEVTNAQSHAWVEYYSYLYGFITADPTPSSALPRALTREEAGAAASSEAAPSGAPVSSEASSAPESPSSAAPEQSSAAPQPSAAPGTESPAENGTPSAGSLRRAILAAALLLLAAYGGKAAYRALWFAAVRGRDAGDAALALYGHFAAVLERLGFALPRSGTPYELADGVRGRMEFGRVGFDRVTQIYAAVRFGEREPTREEREDLFRFYRDLPAACRRKLGKLRYLLLYPLLH